MASGNGRGKIECNMIVPKNGVVDSEFAAVEVGVDDTANGPRLRLEDLRTGRVRFLDALEMETIVWLPEGSLEKWLDPSAHRWRDDGEQWPGR